MLKLLLILSLLLVSCIPRLGGAVGDLIDFVAPPKTCYQLWEAGEVDYFACMYERNNIAGY